MTSRARRRRSFAPLGPTNVSANVLVNDKRPPFDSLKLRQAMSLALDREAFVTILSQGASTISGNMMPPPEGLWGMPKEELEALTDYLGQSESAGRVPARSWRSLASTRRRS